ncbi:MAG: hypothetical protein PHI96_05400 [Desulfovibrio sp.]|nr:hypothetical protein [Desulfovibrio sp.]
MNKASTAARVPYVMLSTALVGCGLFFGMLLWQADQDQNSRDGLLYAPGFAVKAEVVDVVRIVPLAGAMLRSPIVNTNTEYVVQLAH